MGLGTSTLLTGCCEKEECATPSGSVCNTAATVISQSGTLVLQLADGTVLTPTGSLWANFAPTEGQQVTIGVAGKRGGNYGGNCGGNKATSPSPELGCITAVTTATTKAAGSN